MALAVLDASVVIAFRDPSDTLHDRAVNAFRAHAANTLVLPVSAYAEVLVGPLRHSPEAVASLEEFVADFAIDIAPLTVDIARRAAALRAATPPVRLPDAFVLATADALSASVVLTGDAALRKASSRVQQI